MPSPASAANLRPRAHPVRREGTMRSFFCAAILCALVGCKSTPRDADASQAPGLYAVAPSNAPASASSSDVVASAAAEPGEVPAQRGGPVVDLAGVHHAPAPPAEGAPRVGIVGLNVPVYFKPDEGARKIGYLRAGAIIETTGNPTPGGGCASGFVPIAPAGFVCLDEQKVTRNLEHPVVRALARRPDASQKLPYMYGIVTRGGPAYAKLPSEADLEKWEPNLDKHIQKWRKDEVSGAGYGQELWSKWRTPEPVDAWDDYENKKSDTSLPFFFKDGGSVPRIPGGLAWDAGAVKIDQVDRRQGSAFVDTVLFEGRRYAVSTDLRVVPTDRLRPIRGSDYHGVEIGKDVEIPFALIKKRGGKRYKLVGKKLVEEGDLEYRSAHNLTGKQQFFGGKLHYETKSGEWIDDRHASRIDNAKRMPKWGKNGEKWIDVNITKQVLVAFDGEKPVFATLVSTGEDGLEEGARATLKGIFRVHTKYASVTMDSQVVGEEFELRDVPYVQYFEGGYALHGAYWHDTFGTPKSHGCINLAPEDARRLFYFTEPSLPRDWHGVARPLTGTIVFVHP